MSFSALVAAAPHVVNHLPMPASAYGLIALGVGLLLLLITWMFRHSAAAAFEPDHAGHAGSDHAAGTPGHHNREDRGNH